MTAVKDAGQVAGSGTGATFTHPGTGQTQVVRPGTPASTTLYTLAAPTDPYGRITSVKRLLGTSTWIEERTAYDATYPVEADSVTEDYVDGIPSTRLPTRTETTYTTRELDGARGPATEPLTASTHRTTDYTYNANNDVTQVITALDGSGTTRTITRSCHDAGCTLSGNGLTLQKTIENYVDGVAGNGAANVEDVTRPPTTRVPGSTMCGQRSRETRANYTRGRHPPRHAATGMDIRRQGQPHREHPNYADGAVTNPGDDITPNATTGARTDLTTAYAYDTGATACRPPTRGARSRPPRARSLADDYVTTSTFDPLGETLSAREPTRPGSPTAARRQRAARRPRPLTNSAPRAKPPMPRASSIAHRVRPDRERDADRSRTPTAAGGTAAAVTSASTYDAAGRVLTAKDRRQAVDASLGATLPRLRRARSRRST